MINWSRNGAALTSGPNRHSWRDFPEDLPVDVLPCSNEEFLPPPPNRAQLTIRALAEQETERIRRKFNMSRRQFVRTAAASAIGFWAIDMVMPGRFGNYGWADNTATTDACDLEWDGRKGMATLRNLPGEFIFDVQTHHVDPDGQWLVSSPWFSAFFAAIWPQAREGGDQIPWDNLSRHHYLKELYLDSATTCSVLSCVPTSPDTANPLPLSEASQTVHMVNELARSKRAVMHAFVMPNRGLGMEDPLRNKPSMLDEELNLMMERALQYRSILRGWKTYCPWGDLPNVAGWTLDSETGMAFLEQVRNVSRKVPQVPPTVATHKGFALPGFDQRAAQPRDVGPAARQFPDVNFIVYHSGHDIGDDQLPYAGDAKARSDSNTVDGLIKALRENHWDASRFRQKGERFGNVPNVYAELGSVWRDVMFDPDQSAHLLGKLITHIGPKRVVWGTDSLWYGSPQDEIVALRRFEFTARGKELYRLPFGLEGDVEDPTRRAPNPARTIRNGILGRNVAPAYRVNPDRRRNEIDCDEVQRIREDGYLSGEPGDERESAPLAANQAAGPRTRREVLKSISEGPWSP